MLKKDTGDAEVAVRVSNVHKDFYLPHEKSNSIKSHIVNIFKKKDKAVETQHALRGISFEVNKGDFFGIVGRNGCGKSTLLKIISEIYQPTKGKVSVKGKLVPFIELGVGFNPELTGRENVYLNGALLGFSQKEMEEKYEDIVRFAELEEFMDQKLKNYSSGMQVRLAFSVAIRADADILLLDEVLAVGDEAFQRKCNDYFKQLKDNKKTVILVTHSMENVKKYCNKAMLIQDGKIELFGTPEDVANRYSLENLQSTENAKEQPEKKNEKASIVDYFKAELLSGAEISQNDRVVVRYKYKLKVKKSVSISMDLSNIDNNYYLYCSGSLLRKIEPKKEIVQVVSLDTSCINDMNVVVHSSLRDDDGEPIIFTNEADSPRFIIRRTDYGKIPQTGTLFINEKNVKWQ